MRSILAPVFDRLVLPARHLAVVLAYTLTIMLAGSVGFNPAVAQSCASSCTNPGCLDTTFGNCGIVMTDVSHASLLSDHDGAHGLVVQSDSKLIATGWTNLNGSGSQFAAVRYDPDGTLDNTFGNFDPNTNQRTGFVITPFTYQGVTYTVISAYAVALQTVTTASGVEERLVQAGFISRTSGVYDIAVVRYTPAGDLDSSFNGSGKQLVPLGSAHACTIQSDGKIVLFGSLGRDWPLVRLNSDGSLDTSFGSGGKAIVSFGNKVGYSNSSAVTMQQTLAGERILAAGSAYSNKTDHDFALARLNLNGTLDTSFGSGGKVVTDFFRRFDQARSVAIDQATGDILAAGAAMLNSTSPIDFALARYNANGSLRSNFGSGGKVVTDFFGDVDNCVGVAIQWDGKIVAAGHVGISGSYDWGTARYTASGVLDSSFGNAGKVVTDFAGSSDFGGGLALQVVSGFQRIVVAGAAGVADTSSPNYGYNYALARYFE
jgi:uncharacterized delta-60 repeat protein